MPPQMGYIFRPHFCNLPGNFRSAGGVKSCAKLQSQARLGKAILRLSANETSSHFHRDLAKVMPLFRRGGVERWKTLAKARVLVEGKEWFGKTLPHGLTVKFINPALHLMGGGAELTRESAHYE